MLKYFVMTCEALLTAAVLTGACMGYAGKVYHKSGETMLLIGTLLGIISAVVMAYLKNATKLIDTSLWNLRNFVAAGVILILFWVFSALRRPLKRAGDFLPPAVLALLPALVIFYALPDVLAYPYVILLTEKSVLSTNFLLKTVGILCGILLCVLIVTAVHNGMSRMKKPLNFLFLNLLLLVNTARQLTIVLRIMLTKRMIASNHTLFSIAKFSSNHDNWFTFAVIGIAAVIPIILILQNVKITESYHNPAEYRKLRKKRRLTMQWASVILTCMVFSLLNFTVLKAYANREIELSPVEDSVIEDGNVVVRFEQVEDGHLHRFAYTSDNGTKIRFIVIKKPNSSAYGIGLDACDICGETGYYEKDGQVVCNLCDVVMNINTIGFKGGCNPIVIPYNISNGSIYVPIEGLLEYEKEFK